MIGRMTNAWDRYWFATCDKYSYGIFRIIFLTGMLFFRSGFASGAGSFPLEFADPPILIRMLHVPFPPTPEALSFLLKAQGVLLLMGLVGILTRPSLVLLASVTLYIDSFGSSFGLFDHATSLPDLVLLILSVSPGVSAFSLDSLLRRKHESRWPRVPLWPARLILFVLALNYGAAGVAKIRFGSDWNSGKTLAFYMSSASQGAHFSSSANVPEENKWRDGFGLESFVFSRAAAGNPTARTIGESALLSKLFSMGSFLLELTFPVVLVSSRAMPAYFIGGIAFHLGVFFTFGLNFILYTFIYALYVDWRGLARGLAGKR